VIEVDDMHCANCARKIASKLYGVPGVVAVRTSVTANTATITPQQQRQPSPKALWEAVEKAGFKPVKLQGPQGVFVSKPRA
jgi:copper chaperone CopZ